MKEALFGGYGFKPPSSILIKSTIFKDIVDVLQYIGNRHNAWNREKVATKR